MFSLSSRLLLKGRFYSTATSSILVVVEQNGGQVNPSTLSLVTAAKKLGGKVTALVAGVKTEEAAKQVASLNGVDQVVTADAANLEHGLPEYVAPLVLDIQKAHKFTHILSPHSNFGKSVLPRVAAILDVSQLSDVIAINSPDVFVRPIYAGNAISVVQSSDPVKILTVRASSFEKASTGNNAPIQKFTPISDVKEQSKLESIQVTKSDRPDLQTASKVVAGGRALKSAENFKIIYDLADKIGAAVGASRPACDSGYAPPELQVGQTGKTVAPDLYMAFGISGAIQHIAGMKDSKVIVAVNKDADAPIFQISDFGLVDDLFKVVPEMTEKLGKK